MKIVIALDGSEYSQYALEVAVSRKWPAGTEIRLVHVAGPSEDGILSGMFSAFGLAGTNESAVNSAQQALDDIAIGAASRVPGASVKQEVLCGEPISALVEFSRVFGANLIITGTRETRGLEALFLGSVSQGVLEQASCPVLIARSRADLRADHTPKQILVGVDDSAYSGGAIEWLMSQHWLQGSQVCLLSVVDLPPQAGITTDVQSAATQLLTWQAEKLFADQFVRAWATVMQEECGLERVHSGVAEGLPGQLIVKAAKNWPADLVILGSHGRSGIAKLILGSVSQMVARCAPCSVEIVKGIEPRYYDHIRSRVVSESTLTDVLAGLPDTAASKERGGVQSSVNVMPPSLFM